MLLDVAGLKAASKYPRQAPMPSFPAVFAFCLDRQLHFYRQATPAQEEENSPRGIQMSGFPAHSVWTKGDINAYTF